MIKIGHGAIFFTVTGNAMIHFTVLYGILRLGFQEEKEYFSFSLSTPDSKI